MLRPCCICLVLIISACSLKDNAEKMVETSNDIRDRSAHLAKRTDDLEAELGKVETWKNFETSTKALFANPSEAEMLLYAGATIEGLPFQVWKGDYNEDQNMMDIRFKYSAEYLFVRCLSYIPRDFAVDRLLPNSDYKAVASLAVKLDRLSNELEMTYQKRKVTPRSFYDVVIEALTNRNIQARSEFYPKASAMILTYRREAIYLLQLRHNYLPMMVLGRITDLQERGNVGRLWMRLGISDANQVDLNAQGVSFEEIKEWKTWLDQALATRQALRQLGIQPEYNSSFVGILSRVNFGQAKWLTGPPPAEHNSLQKAKYELAKSYMAVVNDGNLAVQAPLQSRAEQARLERAKLFRPR